MKFEIYQRKDGDWGWRRVAKNGKITADGGEGYHSPGNARRAIKDFIREIHQATVVQLIATEKGEKK